MIAEGGGDGGLTNNGEQLLHVFSHDFVEKGLEGHGASGGEATSLRSWMVSGKIEKSSLEWQCTVVLKGRE